MKAASALLAAALSITVVSSGGRARSEPLSFTQRSETLTAKAALSEAAEAHPALFRLLLNEAKFDLAEYRG